jgi:hypothetical protein
MTDSALDEFLGAVKPKRDAKISPPPDPAHVAAIPGPASAPLAADQAHKRLTLDLLVEDWKALKLAAIAGETTLENELLALVRLFREDAAVQARVSELVAGRGKARIDGWKLSR